MPEIKTKKGRKSSEKVALKEAAKKLTREVYNKSLKFDDLSQDNLDSIVVSNIREVEGVDSSFWDVFESDCIRKLTELKYQEDLRDLALLEDKKRMKQSIEQESDCSKKYKMGKENSNSDDHQTIRTISTRR